MRKITLVGTVHREGGLCNEGELITILEAIGPDVIFEEIRASDFEALYRDGSRHTLEMRAVGRYLKAKPAWQVPVDDYLVPDSFRREMATLDEYVESNNAEYSALMDEISQKKSFFGFRFLNSPEFEALNKRANESFESTIAMSGNEDLKKGLSMWNDQIRRRDASMVENIYGFCRKNSFAEGVFLVGAAHLSSIVEDVASRIKREASLVDWNIWNRPELVLDLGKQVGEPKDEGYLHQ